MSATHARGNLPASTPCRLRQSTGVVRWCRGSSQSPRLLRHLPMATLVSLRNIVPTTPPPPHTHTHTQTQTHAHASLMGLIRVGTHLAHVLDTCVTQTCVALVTVHAPHPSLQPLLCSFAWHVYCMHIANVYGACGGTLHISAQALDSVGPLPSAYPTNDATSTSSASLRLVACRRRCAQRCLARRELLTAHPICLIRRILASRVILRTPHCCNCNVSS
jgi:hypothetical protein